MSWTEKKRSNITLADVKDKLNEVYSTECISEHLCWMNKYGVFFKVFCFDNNERSFGIEYASNKDEVLQNYFEDGDLFYVDDYSSLDEMIADMRLEIDGSKQ